MIDSFQRLTIDRRKRRHMMIRSRPKQVEMSQYTPNSLKKRNHLTNSSTSRKSAVHLQWRAVRVVDAAYRRIVYILKQMLVSQASLSQCHHHKNRYSFSRSIWRLSSETCSALGSLESSQTSKTTDLTTTRKEHRCSPS